VKLLGEPRTLCRRALLRQDIPDTSHSFIEGQNNNTIQIHPHVSEEGSQVAMREFTLL
jgi:hypothetical protein